MNALIPTLLLSTLCAGAACAASITPIAAVTAQLKAAPLSVGGRVVSQPDGALTYQWPGTYFETAFEGRSAYFKLGPGRVILHVSVDGVKLAPLVKPQAGLYRVDGLKNGRHALRIEVVSESQAGPNVFGGFALGADARPAALPVRARQIEFIGDSHTVGYGNISASRECSEEQVWETTDNTQAYGPVTARHYRADYRVNAISGRGVVRNYNGFAADSLPQAYPWALFDHAARAADANWHPQVIVIALGTNDFSTPLNAGEKWTTREELRSDYRASYMRFVQGLRSSHPQAYFVLWATDALEGEIQSQAGQVVQALKGGGDARVAFMPVKGLEWGGCHWHPSVKDDAAISASLIQLLDAQPGVWGKAAP
ncbi:MAG: SGNH/GDSL hydrolase family protein [Gammaproteobacteria bacterium]